VGQHRPKKRVAGNLLALSSAAVLGVYSAGYVKTRAAADRFALMAEARRPVLPAPATPGTPAVAEAPKAKEAPRPTEAKPVKRRAVKTPPAIAVPDVAAATPAPSAGQTVELTAPPPAAPTAPVYKDGTYFGWGTSRHGDIQAQVVIENGRIGSATIAQCLTRYSCSVIAKLPPQVAERQSPETDYVSGATQSTNAFYYAVVEALSKAK
jgi:uncharacterized protein with FMN-binding domain